MGWWWWHERQLLAETSSDIASPVAMVQTVHALKILCLHGKGGCSSSFRPTLAPLMDTLGPAVEWDFLDAPHELDGPTSRAWWLLPPGARSFTATNVRHMPTPMPAPAACTLGLICVGTASVRGRRGFPRGHQRGVERARVRRRARLQPGRDDGGHRDGARGAAARPAPTLCPVVWIGDAQAARAVAGLARRAGLLRADVTRAWPRVRRTRAPLPVPRG